ncbi:MAG TPA: hypothetical protein VEB86_09960 [Chryseosolibacter sp.]|nr:hypothetical protein [Chryseosolibacter sp.]
MNLYRIYRLVNILSLDVVAGAVATALLFARVFEVTILPYGLGALALSVWIIYTADHLWDAWRIRGHASSARHRFHQVHFKRLAILLMIAAIADMVLIFFIRPPVFRGGVILLLFTGVYLIVQPRLPFLKEAFVACLYALGVLLPSVAVTAKEFTTSHVILAINFFLVCLLNLYIFSWFDTERDVQDRLGSFVTRFGRQTTSSVIYCLFAFACAFSAILLFLDNLGLAPLYLIVMAAALMAIFMNPGYFGSHDRYRLWGDAVFLLPIIDALWNG